MDKYAVIDLGTNTFHLLIASLTEEGKIIEHFRERRYIHLAEEGIGKIGPKAYGRAIHCLDDFKSQLDKFNIKAINCCGTAALRTASNGKELIHEIYQNTEIKVSLINGISESKYIYKGVKLAVPDLAIGNHVIMDIGGGSVEFIVIKDGHFHWSNSFPVGVAVLKRKFHRSEPISDSEIIEINSFLERQLAKFLFICKSLKFNSLIGASGSFEVLHGMQKSASSADLASKVELAFFKKIYAEVIGLNLQNRLAHPDIPDDRATLIVVALQSMQFVLSKLSFEQLTVSSYAMKEGILQELTEAISTT